MFRIVAFPLGALAILVTLEMVLRAMSVEHEGAGQRALHQLRLDRTWIYGLRPGAEVVLPVTGDVVYRINADGFRDRRYPLAADRPRLRIVVLGASITFGFGVDVDQTYVERLEVLLAARGRDCIDVLNFGVNGYNPYNQQAQLADLGLAYGPDLVLVEFGVAGLQDPAIHFDAQTRLHLGMIPEDAYPNPSMRRRPSRLAGALRLCRSLRTCSILDDAILGAKRPDRRDILRGIGARELPPEAPEWSWLRERYRGMARLAHSANARFAVLAFPVYPQIYGDASGRLQQQLAALGGTEGWPTLDLLLFFRRAAEAGGAPLLLDSWHPSPAGHALAAEAIADWLEAEGLLSKNGSAARCRRLSEADTRRAPIEGSP